MAAHPQRLTRSVRAQDVVQRWWVVDANEQVLGRLASRLASLLRGKRSPLFTPHVDLGDFVIVVNAEKVKLTGNKRSDKLYHRHTGYMGGLKTISADEVLGSAHPERVIEQAVRGMLPKNALGRKLVRKLKVYAGSDHPHAAQKPEALQLG
jgi:large subunit ribosomal protein L13